MSVMAFHEKAGRSQVDSDLVLWNNVCSPAEWPLSPCFHPRSRGAISFRSVHVGRSRFSRCCYLLGAERFA